MSKTKLSEFISQSFTKNLRVFKSNYKVILPILAFVIVILFSSIFYFVGKNSNSKISSNNSQNSQNSQNEIPLLSVAGERGRNDQRGGNEVDGVFLTSNSQNSNSSTFSSSDQSSSQSYSEQKIQEKLENEKKKQNEITKINEFKSQFTQIDLTKNPKPWILLDDELIDNNNQKIIQVITELKTGNGWNNKWLKPILTKENKLYFPFWIGQIAVIDLENGKVNWQDLGFEIKDLSLFDGKYFVTNDCSLDARNCSIFQIDRQTLEKKKILGKDYYRNMGAVSCDGFTFSFANSEYFWMKKRCYDRQINKYKIENGEFVEGFSFAKWPCCASDFEDYGYRIGKELVDFYSPKYADQEFDKDGKKTTKDVRILLEKRLPKTEFESGSYEKNDFKIDEQKADKFYKPADDFWQSLFPFDVKEKTAKDLKAGKCGKFSWDFDPTFHREGYKLKFDNTEVFDNTEMGMVVYINTELSCIQ